MLADLDKQVPVSAYQPSEDVVKFTSDVKTDYAEGMRILNTPWVELNNRSVIDDENRGQLMFNAFVDEETDDPTEAWKWRGTRSMARNKGIVMHAQLTANYLLPLFIAQNEEDEIDVGMSEIMRDIIEWMAQPINSDYQSSFLQIVIGMESNPVTFLGAEYFEIYQKVREKTEKGWEVKEILDEVLSGFKAPIWSASQVLITNAYERNIQRQRRIIKRRYVEKSELEAKWGKHTNWIYVQDGIKSIYSEEEGLFYDVKDSEHPFLVAEETALTRRDDNEVTFLGGIYMGNENIEDNPVGHRDNRGAPKYNVTPFGFSRIGDHFFYYKSMMNSLGWDNSLYDAMSEVVMNNAFLEQDPPTAVYGTDEIDSSLNFPGAVVPLTDKEGRATPIFPPKNFAAGFNALRETEESINKGSLNETMSGQLPQASQKAFTVAQAMANTRKLIGAVAKNLAQSIIQYGDLMKDIAINHVTIPQVEELTGGRMKLNYKSFLLENKEIGGKTLNKKIKFDESLIGKKMSKKKRNEKSLDLLSEIGYPDNKEHLYLVNPERFAKFKYLVKVDVEEMFAKNQEFMQPMLTNLYTLLANDPLVDREGLLRRLFRSYFQSSGDELVKETPLELPQETGKVPSTMLGQMMQGKELSKAITGAV